MSRRNRKLKRKNTETKTVSTTTPKPKGLILWKWTPVVLLLFVAGMAVVFQGIGADSAKSANIAHF